MLLKVFFIEEVNCMLQLVYRFLKRSKILFLGFIICYKKFSHEIKSFKPSSLLVNEFHYLLLQNLWVFILFFRSTFFIVNDWVYKRIHSLLCFVTAFEWSSNMLINFILIFLVWWAEINQKFSFFILICGFISVFVAIEVLMVNIHKRVLIEVLCQKEF